ncbi:MAG: hypothetical protein JWM18_3904 [Chloroflexi bacterium]|nr:hypothetical protein [Chloroflexota bacterium]
MSCGLHDVVSFEGLGRPAVLVASSVFRDVAAAEARNLGQPAIRRVFVPHPIQDRTDDEMREMAAAVAGEVLAALTS